MKLRVAIAQINPIVGSLGKNVEKVLDFTRRAEKEKADIVVFPELVLTGYPPEDLLLKPHFIDENLMRLVEVAKATRHITSIVGFVDREEDIYNAAAIIHKGKVAAVYHKMYLPNYGVFDEERYFQSGAGPLNFTLGGVTIGVGICEDIWYPEGPARAQALAGAQVIININASPYHFGKLRVREEMVSARAMDNEAIVVYCNMVGGQDELVFDGQSMIFDEEGRIIARGKAFEEDLIVIDLDLEGVARKRLHDTRRRKERRKAELGNLKVRSVSLPGKIFDKKKAVRTKRSPAMPLPPPEEVFQALVLGVKDYVKKNGFKRCVIGFSGGIDSSLVATIAVEAIGRKNITGVFMPSGYTSRESSVDAVRLAKNLGLELLKIPIQPVFEEYLKTLKPSLKKRRTDVTEENLQARVRGNILMALSNKFGWLVLTTGNKSEMSVGYATLYGDMAGGFAVIKDVPKTLVYALALHVNERAGKAVIPERVITKAPTAELKANQTDQDTLPPYGALDEILKAYVEDDKSLDDIISMGFKKTLVRRVIDMVDKSEYKRRQAPPGVKITPRALGKDRRMPITNKYKER
ncbi:MAG: NAD+ synthase [Thermodesulfobacteriota bacterium]